MATAVLGGGAAGAAREGEDRMRCSEAAREVDRAALRRTTARRGLPRARRPRFAQPRHRPAGAASQELRAGKGAN